MLMVLDEPPALTIDMDGIPQKPADPHRAGVVVEHTEPVVERELSSLVTLKEKALASPEVLQDIPIQQGYQLAEALMGLHRRSARSIITAIWSCRNRNDEIVPIAGAGRACAAVLQRHWAYLTPGCAGPNYEW